MNAAAKHIVFDWNSTLLDDFAALHDCTNRLLLREGLPAVEAEHFREHYNIPFETLYRNMGLTDAQIDKIMHLENTEFHDHYEPLADRADLRLGGREILEHAQANNVGSLILSNHLVESIRGQLKRLGIESYFAEIIAYANRAVQFRDGAKGDKLRRFMHENKIDPASTIIVGDSVEEIHIGKEQGLISVAITGGCVSEKRLRAERPDHVIHDLHELKTVLQERGFAA
jgi:phosphoglycolate phosphatase